MLYNKLIDCFLFISRCLGFVSLPYWRRENKNGLWDDKLNINIYYGFVALLGYIIPKSYKLKHKQPLQYASGQYFYFFICRTKNSYPNLIPHYSRDAIVLYNGNCIDSNWLLNCNMWQWKSAQYCDSLVLRSFFAKAFHAQKFIRNLWIQSHCHIPRIS
jgi:hypothetical protein